MNEIQCSYIIENKTYENREYISCPCPQCRKEMKKEKTLTWYKKSSIARCFKCGEIYRVKDQFFKSHLTPKKMEYTKENQIGVAWDRISKVGNKYISVKLELPEAVYNTIGNIKKVYPDVDEVSYKAVPDATDEIYASVFKSKNKKTDKSPDYNIICDTLGIANTGFPKFTDYGLADIQKSLDEKEFNAVKFQSFVGALWERDYYLSGYLTVLGESCNIHLARKTVEEGSKEPNYTVHFVKGSAPAKKTEEEKKRIESLFGEKQAKEASVVGKAEEVEQEAVVKDQPLKVEYQPEVNLPF
jgi:uncharacterized protein (DUF736 family)